VPTYQYQCTECGEGLEAVQKFTDDALTVCPNCQGRLKKVFSAVGIVFKGSGFYRTDSRSGASTSAGDSGDKVAAAKDTGSTGTGSNDTGTASPGKDTSSSAGSSSGGSSGSSSSTPSSGSSSTKGSAA
jgi:putative FmdB family regulatory protein